jgi:hypothetical protein
MDPELSREVRTLIEWILTVRPVGAAMTVERKVAVATGGLPVHVDIGGALVITPEGEIRRYS